MDQTLPSDRLKQPRHPWRIAIIAAASLLVVAGGVVVGAAALQPPTAKVEAGVVHLWGGPGKPTEPQVTHKLLLTTHVAKSTTPPPPPPAPENYYGNPGPIQCGYGYTAGAVDDYGNESNCYANGPGNAQCVAYDDNNNCTQYYKP